jgi:hypothetical protein
LTLVYLTIAVIVFEIAALFPRLGCVTFYHFALNAKPYARAACCLTIKKSFIYEVVTIIIFCVTNFLITRTAGQVS